MFKIIADIRHCQKKNITNEDDSILRVHNMSIVLFYFIVHVLLSYLCFVQCLASPFNRSMQA